MQEILTFETIDDHGPQHRKLTVRPTPEELDRPEITSLGAIELEVDAAAGDIEGEYLVDGKVSYSADLLCSRCVDPFPFAITSRFTVRYRPRPATLGAEEELEIAPEELEVEFYSEPAVSLRELAIEQVQLSLPMKPLCDESCLGLCPRCGANLNREGCSCAEAVTDERWGALREFREQLAKKKDV